MANPLRALEEALAPHVSAINARVIIERSRRTLRDPNRLFSDEHGPFFQTVRGTLLLFTNPDRTTRVVAELERRLSAEALATAEEKLCFELHNENDLRNARAAARAHCLAFSSSASAAQRLATAVSELGRNIINYTPGGQIEIEIRRGPPVQVRLVASDRGSGIADLDSVLNGTFRSKTGLGRGLLGVKRLMEQFRVHTGSDGTRIEAEVRI